MTMALTRPAPHGPRRAGPLGALALAAGLCGCAVIPEAPQPAPAIVVDRVTLGTLDVTGIGDALPPQERQALADDITALAAGEPFSLHLTILTGDGGLDDDILATAQQVGVPARNVTRGGTRPRTKSIAAADILVERYRAFPPHCGPRAIVGHRGNVTPDAGFGCATYHDLALAVADPADLVGRTDAPQRDGERASIPVEAYRNFRSPGAEGRDFADTARDGR